MTTHRITPEARGCHPGCRVFGDSGVVLEYDVEHDRWHVEVPEVPTEIFSHRFEAYPVALLAAYRVSTLDNLETL